MTRRRRVVLVLLLLLLLIGVGLTLFLRDVVGQFIVQPLLYVLWVSRLFLGSIHQVIYWFLLIAVVLILAIRSLIGRWGRWKEEPLFDVLFGGRVRVWARWVELATERYYYRGYFKWRLARQLGELTQDVLAYRERLTPREVRRELEAGGFNLPPDIRAYLEAGLLQRSFSSFREMRRRSRRFRFLPNREPSPLDIDPMRVIRFLQQQMEG